jgi:hypothetical protein
VDGARHRPALDVSSLLKATVSEMRSEILADAKAKARQEFDASVNLTRNGMHALRIEYHQIWRDCGTLDMKMGDIAQEQALLNPQPTVDP